MADDQDGREPERPSLKVVSDNPNVDKTRPIHFAKEEAERTLVVAAATMLRTIAGSEGAAAALRNDMLRALLAEDEYQALSGQWLASWERKEVLALAQPDWEEDGSDRRICGAARGPTPSGHISQEECVKKAHRSVSVRAATSVGTPASIAAMVTVSALLM
jgi:hypothetical protein